MRLTYYAPRSSNRLFLGKSATGKSRLPVTLIPALDPPASELAPVIPTCSVHESEWKRHEQGRGDEGLSKSRRHEPVVQSKAQLGQRPAAFGDMAVLVRTHRQAEQIHESLRRHGIAA